MFKKVVFGTVAVASLLNAAGYKVPEQSSDAVSLLSSNIATSFGADVAYYNPANMMFLPENRHYFEANLAWFHINSVKFNSNNSKSYKSNKFDSLASTMHSVSPEYYENFRFGMSLAVPAGVGISWDDPDTAFTAKRFKLKVIELNPSVAYKVSDNFAVATGLRVVYTKGMLANELYGLGDRALHGDGVDFGYNLALTYKPTPNWSLAATYRSKIDLDIKGNSKINVKQFGINYNGKVEVNIPLPAQLALATSYKIQDTTLMFSYERTYWSKFTGYDFEYPGRNPMQNKLAEGFFQLAFDNKVIRDYRDTNTYRFGVAHDATDRLRLMAGFVYDQKAAKNKHSVSLELPDTTSLAYSLGLNYKINHDLELSLGGLYQDRKKNDSSIKMAKLNNGMPMPFNQDGEISKAAIWIINSGIKYKF
ncbi:OmpP1/FadL family transporter [Campylobacter pinnipediorum]|uniref:OmpP1/FadL family transporter n=1 Tax=Campylobacter pinnipediorum TaxID=1965231 RepID=UPI0009948FF8|nr:outer membrane protein transport protein [Campylobacter pinnipediorum]AQW83631.1 outer membrane transport protein (OMPP1/FadL/TodX family) [Campylobacter pinnipediorum subsp. pinnipediorum]